MEWLTNSEAMVWKKIYVKFRGSTVTTKKIRKYTKAKALKKKVHKIVRKGWFVRVCKGKYYIPEFDGVIMGNLIEINSLDDVKRHSKNLPLAVGSPANSDMHWYPMRKPQSLYAFREHHSVIRTKYTIRELSDEMFRRSIDIDGVKMLSLEDTIIESLMDHDVQAAMAMAHRQKEKIDWAYLLRRIHNEHLEKLAYVSLSDFSETKKLAKYRDRDMHPLTNNFIEKTLQDNTIYAMRHN